MNTLSDNGFDYLVCLRCKSKMHKSTDGNQLACCSCSESYPIVDGVPIIIDDETSFFKKSQFLQKKNTTYSTPKSRVASFVFKHLPCAEINTTSNSNYTCIAKMLNKNANVLVIGGGIDGAGFDILRNRNDLAIIATDVTIGAKTNIICDAHDLPFEDKSFQCVVIQAVLEHVFDPKVCVENAYRVLSDDGIIYSETPFMQQVHMGAFDFQRYTELGHRRLFSKFEEISRGIVCGTGSALCWSLIYFVQSFASNRRMKTILHILGRLLFFPLKYFDYLTSSKKGALDGASGFYFLGRKSRSICSDEEIVSSYKGLC